jgi:hypothetical protein
MRTLKADAYNDLRKTHPSAARDDALRDLETAVARKYPALAIQKHASTGELRVRLSFIAMKEGRAVLGVIHPAVPSVKVHWREALPAPLVEAVVSAGSPT